MGKVLDFLFCVICVISVIFAIAFCVIMMFYWEEKIFKKLVKKKSNSVSLYENFLRAFGYSFLIPKRKYKELYSQKFFVLKNMEDEIEKIVRERIHDNYKRGRENINLELLFWYIDEYKDEEDGYRKRIANKDAKKISLWMFQKVE